MSRVFKFSVTIETGGDGNADFGRVEELLALHVQDLLYDEEFVAALDESVSISSTVLAVPNLDNQKG